MKGSYQDAVERTSPPSRLTLERITAEQVELNSYTPPPEENIPVSVDPFPVYELEPMEDIIQWTVTRLQNHRSGETWGMRAKHLKG